MAKVKATDSEDYKEKIKDILDKIYLYIENEGINKNYLLFRFKNTGVPQRKQEILCNLFPVGFPDVVNIKVFEESIAKAKKKAKNYNRAELVIGALYEFRSDKAIILYYYETDKEVYERLVSDYNSMLEQDKINEKEEYEKYQQLRLKYGSKNKAVSRKTVK